MSSSTSCFCDRNAHFVGRLATYKYYNMDQIVAQALTVYAKIVGEKRKEAAVRVMPLIKLNNGNGATGNGHRKVANGRALGAALTPTT